MLRIVIPVRWASSPIVILPVGALVLFASVAIKAS
jgi:hypothetical protein